MPTFDTPEPIALSLEFGVGDIHIVASDRRDTVVDVQPSDPSKKSDITAAGETRVEYANGSLLVKAPKGWRYVGPSSRHGSIDVRLEVPTGSAVRGSAGSAPFAARDASVRAGTGRGWGRSSWSGPAPWNSSRASAT